LGVVFSY